jgi:hypothetical protein
VLFEALFIGWNFDIIWSVSQPNRQRNFSGRWRKVKQDSSSCTNYSPRFAPVFSPENRPKLAARPETSGNVPIIMNSFGQTNVSTAKQCNATPIKFSKMLL